MVREQKEVAKRAASGARGTAAIPRLVADALRLERDGNSADADALCEEVLAIEPNQPDALHLRGVIASRAGTHESAIEWIGRAIQVSGSVAAYHVNLGNALKGLGRLADAVLSYSRAVELQPDLASAHYNLGIAAMEQGSLEPSVAALRRAVDLAPEQASAHGSLGAALMELGQMEEPEASLARSLQLAPASAERHNNRGIVLRELGRYDEALTSYRAALAQRPDYANAHWNMGLGLLLRGDFENGLGEHEWRWRLDADAERRMRGYGSPLWSGEVGGGRTILLWPEQGAGDSIQFVRFARQVADRDWRVVVEAPRSLARLFHSIEGIETVTQGEPLPPYDAHCPLLSLPFALGTRFATIPAAVPYIRIDPSLAAKWRDWVGNGPRPKVGLVWRGKATQSRNRYRSVDPTAIAYMLGDLPATLVSLQKDASPNELAAVGGGRRTLDAGREFADFADTAALMASLDVVISVDTAVCHLAGATGVRTWALLDFAPDWRWFREREDSPWYPTMRLFRQPKRGDWSAVAGRVRNALVAYAKLAEGGEGR